TTYSIPTLSLSVFTSFFSHTPPPPPIYTLSLHDALPISDRMRDDGERIQRIPADRRLGPRALHELVGADHRRRHPPPVQLDPVRSEEHTSELQSRGHLVCRLLLEKKKNNTNHHHIHTQPA